MSLLISWWRRHFGSLTWQEVVDTASNPSDIASAVQRQVRFKADNGPDAWSTGKETWDRGYGDCEDIAATIGDLCREKGWESWTQVFGLKGMFVGHAVAMGRWNGKLWLANGSSHTTVDSMEEAQRCVAWQMGWSDVRKVTTTTMDTLGIVAQNRSN